MKAGDLVVKRWGRLDPYQQNGAIAICLEPRAIANGLLCTGRLIKIVYPGRKPEMYRPEEFEVISESR